MVLLKFQDDVAARQYEEIGSYECSYSDLDRTVAVHFFAKNGEFFAQTEKLPTTPVAFAQEVAREAAKRFLARKAMGPSYSRVTNYDPNSLGSSGSL